MKIIERTYDCAETFPVELYEEWQVKERGKVVENWKVIDIDSKKGAWFTVAITFLEENEDESI
jgi:hypothetical protein